MNHPIPSDAELLLRIENFCEQQGMGVTTFGRNALGDPNLVANMRRGRSLTLKTAALVTGYIGSADNLVSDDHGADDAAPQHGPSIIETGEKSNRAEAQA